MVAPVATTETLAIPLGGLTEASVRLSFGGGTLRLHQAEPGLLLAGTFEGGVRDKSHDEGKLELEQIDPGRSVLSGCQIEWDVAVTSEIPVDLRLQTGANQASVDLSTLRVRRIELHTGASDTTLRLPTAGQTAVHVECGFAQVTIEVPDGVAARIHGKIGFGALDVDESRFSRTPDGWATAGFDGAPDRVDISVSGGFGAVRIH